MNPIDQKGESKAIDERLLQRLVDGELSNDAIAALLSKAEKQNHQDHWKQIALAFTENQIWHQSFGEIVSVQDPAQESSVSSEKNFASPKLTQPQTNVEQSNVKRPLAAALAASLLVGVVAVYQFATYQSAATENLLGGNNDDTLAIVEDASTTKPGPSPIESFDRVTLAAYTPDHRLKAQDLTALETGKYSGDVPLFDARRFEAEHLSALKSSDPEARQAMFAKVLPAGLSREQRDRVQKSGGMVDENLEFISGRLDDGRSYLIPYRTIRYFPGQ